MFKTVDELKAFISWAKAQGMKEVKVGDISFTVSDVATAIDYQAKAAANASSSIGAEEKNTSKTLVDEDAMDPKEYEELLFHSSN